QPVASLPLAVEALDPLLDKDAVLVDDEVPREGGSDEVVPRRHAERRVLLRREGVDHVQLAHDVAADVREHGELDAVAAGELLEDLYRVIADREDRDAVPFVIRKRALQLDELRSAGRSPPGTAVEQQHRAPVPPRLVKIDDLSVLVRQDDVG